MFFLVMLEFQPFDLRVRRAPLGMGLGMGASLAVPTQGLEFYIIIDYII